MKTGKLAWVLFTSILCLPSVTGGWDGPHHDRDSGGGDRDGPHHGRIEKHKIHNLKTHGDGAMHIYDRDGNLLKVIVPVKNRRAQWAVHRNRGKADNIPPEPQVPQPLLAQDVMGISENIVDTSGLLAVRVTKPANETMTLAMLFLWDGGFNDLTQEAASYPVSLVLVNPNIDDTSLDILAGESVSITLDGGRTLTVAFPAAVQVDLFQSATFYLDSNGKLYCDEALTQALDPNGGC